MNIDYVILSCASEFETKWLFEISKANSVQRHVVRIWHASNKRIWNRESGFILICQLDFGDFIINLAELEGHVFNIFVVNTDWNILWCEGNILIFTKTITLSCVINYILVP